MSSTHEEYARPWQRMAAYAIDYALVFSALLAAQLLIFLVGKGWPYSALTTGLQIEGACC